MIVQGSSFRCGFASALFWEPQKSVKLLSSYRLTAVPLTTWKGHAIPCEVRLALAH
jgi:hypothetical protein